MKFFIITFLLILFLSPEVLLAQGPPITTDNPIMLGGNSYLFKSLTEIRTTERGTFVNAPLIAQYVVSNNFLVGLHLPYVDYSFKDEYGGMNGNGLGDISLLAKYQFLRKDQMGKTFRMVAKTMHDLPTGEKLGIDGISEGMYSGYYGIVAGYESLRLGVSNEIGYKWQPDGNGDNFIYKLGFGLPLLKPTYPVDQLNLYFEYTSEAMIEQDIYRLLYAQGIQYAKNKWTWEAALQFPLIQNGDKTRDINYTIFLGTRFIL
ncbi:hypothetical protein SAMN03097699_0484 [Flavobacteriaceae bacterium MAR_2010_188]|nr:hypothetical protein SAMN03097699_0484 [Flavobacteriaceae bacterium MAR_2010_188]